MAWRSVLVKVTKSKLEFNQLVCVKRDQLAEDRNLLLKRSAHRLVMVMLCAVLQRVALEGQQAAAKAMARQRIRDACVHVRSIPFWSRHCRRP